MRYKGGENVLADVSGTRLRLQACLNALSNPCEPLLVAKRRNHDRRRSQRRERYLLERCALNSLLQPSLHSRGLDVLEQILSCDCAAGSNTSSSLCEIHSVQFGRHHCNRTNRRPDANYQIAHFNS